MTPNVSRHWNSLDFFISDKKLPEGESRKTTDVEHRVSLKTFLNRRCQHSCCGPTAPGAERQRAAGEQAGLLLQVQDGTSRSAVLSTADVAVLCRSAHAWHG